MLTLHDPDFEKPQLQKRIATHLARSFSGREFCLWLFIPLFLLTAFFPLAAESVSIFKSQPDHFSALLSMTWTCLEHYGMPAGATSAFAYLLTFWLGTFQQRAGVTGMMGVIFLIAPCPSPRQIIGWMLFICSLGVLVFILKRLADAIEESHMR